MLESYCIHFYECNNNIPTNFFICNFFSAIILDYNNVIIIYKVMIYKWEYVSLSLKLTTIIPYCNVYTC